MCIQKRIELPLVTVITLTYMNFEHLLQTVASVFKQDYPNIEYIISDDGSDVFPQDEIENYIKKHKTANVFCRILRHSENVGTVKHCNSAYKAANGDFVFPLSCGDIFFEEGVISAIVNRFIKTNAEIIVATGIKYKDNFQPICLHPHFEDRKKIHSLKTGLEQYKAYITGQDYNMAWGCLTYFTKRILQRMNYFDENYVFWEDGPFLAKVLLVSKLEFAYDIVTIWYESGGLTGDNKLKRTQQFKNNARTRFYNDIIKFNQHERIRHMDLFTNSEQRLIRFKVRYFYYEHSKWPALRYIVGLLFLPEYISRIIYSHKRNQCIRGDLKEIKRLLEITLKPSSIEI